MRTVRYIFLSFILCALCVLPACAADSETDKRGNKVQTVEWYMAPENKAVLKATLKECNNNPGELKDDPNCINAATANHKLWATRPAPTNW